MDHRNSVSSALRLMHSTLWAVPLAWGVHPLTAARGAVNANTSWHLLALIDFIPGWVVHGPLATQARGVPVHSALQRAATTRCAPHQITGAEQRDVRGAMYLCSLPTRIARFARVP